MNFTRRFWDYGLAGLTKWGVVGKVIFADLQEASVSGKATDACLQLLLSQRVQHHVHASKRQNQDQFTRLEIFQDIDKFEILKKSSRKYHIFQTTERT